MDGIDSKGGLGGIAQALAGSANTAAAGVARTAPMPETSAAKAAAAAPSGTANLISLLADASPPIDSKKVEAIRSLIAQGRYPIDQHAIAAKMVALDVPRD